MNLIDSGLQNFFFYNFVHFGIDQFLFHLSPQILNSYSKIVFPLFKIQIQNI